MEEGFSSTEEEAASCCNHTGKYWHRHGVKRAVGGLVLLGPSRRCIPVQEPPALPISRKHHSGDRPYKRMGSALFLDLRLI